MNYKTEQENFWSGKFGDGYVSRSHGGHYIASSTNLFARIFNSTHSVHSVIEFGANIGFNIKAIQHLLPDAMISAVEINEIAVRQLNEIKNIRVYHTSILDFQPEEEMDFVFSKGVLIHINPDELERVYDLFYKTSKKYICIAEYYNPTPVEVNYRGHRGKLFKRDFAGEIMDQFPDLTLVDYGFVYHRDNNFPQDDITWFLMEK